MQADELGDFLRTRRARLAPGDVGLAASNTRRTPGLRREEVAVLAGVGVSWLTRLEQGRANRVSGEVLSAIAAALRLSHTERGHLFNLAGVHHAEPLTERADLDSHRRLVDGLVPNPAYVLDHHWDLVVWNSSEQELFPVLEQSGPHPNLLRLFLEREELRTVIDDWKIEVDRLTRQFRAHVTNFPSSELEQLAAEMRAEHEVFSEAWDRHDVAQLTPHMRVINHEAGPLRFDQHRLSLPDHPGWQLVLFLSMD